MKLLLVLLCLLLCGCSQEAPETETEIPTVTAATVPETQPVSMYEAGHPLEEKYQGALKVYPLTMRKVQGIRALGDGLLVFSGYGRTTLTMLTGDELFVSASLTLNFELAPNDPSVRISDRTVSYYDPVKKETVVLNDALKEVSRIALEEEILGSPILSSDRNTLYYCTSNAIQAWNLETGIHRTVKELAYDDQQLTGLHRNDSVLQCRIQDGKTTRTVFLAADTGLLLYEDDGDLKMTSSGSRYYASVPTGSSLFSVFGEGDEAPMLLLPTDMAAECVFLEEQHAAVTASLISDQSVQLEYYVLATGTRRSVLTEEFSALPKSIAASDPNSVYFLVYDPAEDCDTLYCWDIVNESSLILHEETNYTLPYPADSNPDQNTLAECQAYAAQISEKYGIEVRIWEDALAVQPWDYTFEAETLTPVLMRELHLLDQRLGQFPEAMLEKTKSHFTALKICLVRQITGTAASGSLNTATGIQFLDGTDAYVAITTGRYSQQALYHELFHVMETHILNESVALDLWNDLNPSDFTYTYGYDSAVDSSVYLEGENRAFVDAYSMTFPKEDRARIMESAMLPGNSNLFRSEILQNKLAKLCLGIREAYGLRKSPETFPWEQYLLTPLAYSG